MGGRDGVLVVGFLTYIVDQYLRRSGIVEPLQLDRHRDGLTLTAERKTLKASEGLGLSGLIILLPLRSIIYPLLSSMDVCRRKCVCRRAMSKRGFCQKGEGWRIDKHRTSDNQPDGILATSRQALKEEGMRRVWKEESVVAEEEVTALTKKGNTPPSNGSHRQTPKRPGIRGWSASRHEVMGHAGA